MEQVEEVKETAAADLGALLDAREGAVVTLVAGDTRLAAHRAVLAERSPVFATVLQHIALEDSNGQVEIPDVEGPVLRQLLAYVYTLQAPHPPSMDPQLLVAADKYGLSGLKSACERRVAGELSVENVAAAAVLALRLSCPRLKQAAVAFIKAHMHQVMLSKGWVDAVVSDPLSVVELTRLITEPPVATSAPAPADSGATPVARSHSEHSASRHTPASAAPPTAARHTSPPDDVTVSRLRSPAPAVSGAIPATQPHSGQTPASAAPPTAAHRTAPPDDAAVSRLCGPTPAASGSTAPTAQPHSDFSVHSGQTAASDVSSMAAYPSPPSSDAIASQMCDPATTGTWRAPGIQPHSGHSDLSHTPVAAAPPVTPSSIPPSDEGTFSHLQSLSEEEKGRRLLQAAKEGAVTKLQALIGGGVAVGASDGDKMAPLHWAAERGHVDSVRALLEGGAEVDTVDDAGWTPLHWAAKSGHTDVATLLLEAGADKDAKDEDRFTPLHLAAKNGHTAVVRLLAAYSADPNAKEADGWTPLHWAIFCAYAEVATALLEAGADKGITDDRGRSPLDLAREFHRDQLLYILTKC